jgi:hypothetical protein
MLQRSLAGGGEPVHTTLRSLEPAINVLQQNFAGIGSR